MSNFSQYFPIGSSGGGGGTPINSYAPFSVAGTSNPTGYDATTGLYTHPDGTFWVKTGFTISGVSSTYPDAFTNSGATAYSGFSFSVAGEITSNANDVTFDGTNFYVISETMNRIYQYDTAGVYTGFNFSIGAQNSYGRGIANNATNIYMTAGLGDRVWEYDATGTYTGFNFNPDPDGYNTLGLSANSTHIFNNGSTRVRRWTLAGVLVNWFNVPTGTRDVASDDSNVYTLNTGTRVVTEYTFTGTATGFTFSTAAQSTTPYGISKYGNKFHVVDRTSLTVYEYETALTVGDTIARTDTDSSQPLFIRIG